MNKDAVAVVVEEASSGAAIIQDKDGGRPGTLAVDEQGVRELDVTRAWACSRKPWWGTTGAECHDFDERAGGR